MDDTQAALRDLAAGLGRMEGTLEGMAKEQGRLADECKAIRTDISASVGAIGGRVDSLEEGRVLERGIATGVGAVAGFLAAWVKGLFVGGAP